MFTSAAVKRTRERPEGFVNVYGDLLHSEQPEGIAPVEQDTGTRKDGCKQEHVPHLGIGELLTFYLGGPFRVIEGERLAVMFLRFPVIITEGTSTGRTVRRVRIKLTAERAWSGEIPSVCRVAPLSYHHTLIVLNREIIKVTKKRL